MYFLLNVQLSEGACKPMQSFLFSGKHLKTVFAFLHSSLFLVCMWWKHKYMLQIYSQYYDFIVLLQIDTVVNIHNGGSITRDSYNFYFLHLCDVDEGLALGIFFWNIIGLLKVSFCGHWEFSRWCRWIYNWLSVLWYYWKHR
jgi:hypothetical protein